MKKVIVVVSDSARGEMASVAERLAAAGMQVGQILDSSGIVTGEVDDHLQPGLGLIPGISSVELEETIQLPPPDAPVQ